MTTKDSKNEHSERNARFLREAFVINNETEKRRSRPLEIRASAATADIFNNLPCHNKSDSAGDEGDAPGGSHTARIDRGLVRKDDLQVIYAPFSQFHSYDLGERIGVRFRYIRNLEARGIELVAGSH